MDLSKTPQRDSYEVVRREDAIQVLDGLATQMGSSPDLPPLLAKAREKLTADWRPPLSPDGLILLRRVKSLEAAKPNTEALITPSQMKAVAAEAPPDKEEVVCRPCADLAQASQAKVLVQASQGGIPFCEECSSPSAAAS